MRNVAVEQRHENNEYSNYNEKVWKEHGNILS